MISRDEVEQIQHDNEQHLHDRLVHLRRSNVKGDYGENIAVWSTVAEWDCGFAYSPFKFRSREIMADSRVPISEILVRCRMPAAARGTIDPADRVVLTHKFGRAVPEETYEVQGYEEQTIYGFILNLRRTGV